ncbi:MAG TPA: hypothetical protein VKT53_17570 [Candidatus Acidoferrum sp.]|nr:hypothetical protein [Candidatus Acidoferrum sp.]
MSRDPFPNEPEIDDRAERTAVPVHRDSDRDRNSDNQTVASGDDHERPEIDDSVRAYYLRDRTYILRESEFTTLVEIGKFRVVDSADLAQFAYGGDAERAARDLRNLERQGLVVRKPLTQEPKRSERLVVLKKKAKRLLLNSGRVPQGQAIYHGLVKPREVKHDTALYRLYQKEANRISREGGKPLRVVLDYELKRNVQRELAGLGEAAQTRDAREQVAARHGLALVGDRIQIPDLRLEYETADHEHRETNLELATRNYRPRALAQKAKAGFSIYAPREDASKLRRILDESELTARIFSL